MDIPYKVVNAFYDSGSAGLWYLGAIFFGVCALVTFAMSVPDKSVSGYIVALCMLCVAIFGVVQVVIDIRSEDTVKSGIVRLDDEWRSNCWMRRGIIPLSESPSGSDGYVIASGNNYYYYYVENGDTIRGNINASETRIRYIDPTTETPRIEQFNDYRVEIWQYKDQIYESDGRDDVWYYVLCIPEGSVVESFELH